MKNEKKASEEKLRYSMAALELEFPSIAVGVVLVMMTVFLMDKAIKYIF